MEGVPLVCIGYLSYLLTILCSTYYQLTVVRTVVSYGVHGA